MNCWQPKLELMSRAKQEDLRLKGLKSTVEAVYENVSFYYERMPKARVSQRDIQSLRDLKEIPPTTPNVNLVEKYPFVFLLFPEILLSGFTLFGNHRQTMWVTSLGTSRPGRK